jgi:hypothetical protein
MWAPAPTVRDDRTAIFANKNSSPYKGSCKICLFNLSVDSLDFFAEAAAVIGLHNQVGHHRQAVAAVLDANKISYVGEFATRNADFRFFNKGALTGNLYGWFDALIGLIWLRAKMQRCIMDGFASVNRVPYNEQGYTLIRAWCADAIRAAKNVGVIDEGISLSESQRAQITQELGQDIADELYAKGWFLQVDDPEASVRAQRGSPVMSLYITYGGSVQKIECPVTQIQ